jgi:hypothetical protein
MATQPKKTVRSRRFRGTDRTVVYRGIKIAPLSGKRSQLARTLREALNEKQSAEPAGSETANP